MIGMTERPPSWLAGYHAAIDADAATITLIPVPAECDECQRIDFVTGFLIGARDRRNAELMDELERLGG